MANTCPLCKFDNPAETKFCSNCGAPIQADGKIPESSTRTMRMPAAGKAGEAAPGSLFGGRYKILEILGKGGMGIVYKVLDTDIDEILALKLIKPEIASDEDLVRRFRNELKIARTITHKNVCRMHDLRKTKDTFYITMEFVQGEDLKNVLRKTGSMGPGQAISIARQIGEGLAEAHRLGIIHRDLKPQNIIIDPAGQAHIMDFGIARSMRADMVTQTGVMIGTPEYMSPEQVEGHDVDKRTDIYALGIIIFEMLTARVPFEGKTAIATAIMQQNQPPPDPKTLNPSVPDPLKAVILHCMEKHKEQRYPSVEDLIADLSRIEQGLPVEARVAAPGAGAPYAGSVAGAATAVPAATAGGASVATVLPPIEKPAPSPLKKFLVPGLAAIAAIAVILLIINPFRPSKPAAPEAAAGDAAKPSLAVLYFENNTGDKNLDHWRKALSELFIADISQSKYFRVLSGDRLFRILNQMNQLEATSYSSDVIKQIASKANVENVIRGGYVKAGSVFRINIAVENIKSGETVGSDNAQGPGEESIFGLVDELTKKIKANFRLSPSQIAGDNDKLLEKITTNSPEAFKLYVDAVQAGNKGDFRGCITLLEKAVAKDPEFASAYRSMAVAYGNLGYKSEEQRYIQKAFELKDRISDRELYQIMGDFYGQSEKTYDQAIKAYSQLTKLYPDSRLGNTNLGLLYINLEDWDKAIERLEVNKQNRVETFPSYINLAIAYMAAGNTAKARESLNFYLTTFSDNPIIRGALAVSYLCERNFEAALKEIDKALAADPDLTENICTKGDILFSRGDVAGAEKEYRKLTSHKETVANVFGRDRLAAVALMRGKLREAAEELQKGIGLAETSVEADLKADLTFRLVCVDIKLGTPEKALELCGRMRKAGQDASRPDWERRALFYQGLAQVRVKDAKKATETAAELRTLVASGMNQKNMRYVLYLEGTLGMAEGAGAEVAGKSGTENSGTGAVTAAVVSSFEKAVALLHKEHWPGIDYQALFVDGLADAYFAAGDLEKARENFEKLGALTTGRLFCGDLYARSFFRLGQIYEKKGDAAKAAAAYAKFVEMWKDADAGSAAAAEVKEAQTKLAALKK